MSIRRLMITEEQLKNWSGPPSDTEEEKATSAEKALDQAIKKSQHPLLSSGQYRIFAKGSYPNNTNVRLDSDIDIAIEHISIQRFDKEFEAKSLSNEDLGITLVNPLDHQTYTDAVEQALRIEFWAETIDSKHIADKVLLQSTGMGGGQ